MYSSLAECRMEKPEFRIKDHLNVLFTCVGRRVSLLERFRAAGRQLAIETHIIGTDSSPMSAALHLCDSKCVVPPVRHPDYLDQLLGIVSKHHVNLLVPTTDLDLKLLARNKPAFEALACCVLVSRPEVIATCQDKRQSFQFLTQNGFDTPHTLNAAEALNRRDLSYPCFLKPWDGHASRGTAKVENRQELEIMAARIPNCIVQEFVEGSEYTCDVFVDFDMNVRCVVPRERIETRGGEVSKGRTVRNEAIMSRTRDLVETIGAGPGVITIQLIVDAGGKINFIEINPRFGGGVLLSIRAGADFPRWILEQLAGREPDIEFGRFKDNLTMLRYDSEVWIEPG
jgi:carbamoyl-phosphate synthase large subunit